MLRKDNKKQLFHGESAVPCASVTLTPQLLSCRRQAVNCSTQPEGCLPKKIKREKQHSVKSMARFLFFSEGNK